MKSRIPRLDALEVFVPLGGEQDPELLEVRGRTGKSRWFAADGKHRVLILYEGGSYDPARFTLIKEAWDHEHCDHCQAQIPPMTLCWMTRDDPVVILCDECHTAFVNLVST
jgi:hypothetical protein